jgi:hypothetical protein
VYLLAGRINAFVFFIVGITLSIALSECIRRKTRLEKTVLISMAAMLTVSVMLVLSYAYKYNVNPLSKLESFVGTVVDHISQNAAKYKATSTFTSQDLDKILVDPELTKKNILAELPSAATIGLLVLVVGNLLLLLRLNLCGSGHKLGVKPDFFKFWKAPDHLVWPTLVAGFLLVIEVPVLTDVGLNVFKVLMAIYAIQGLAIIGFLFDIWSVKGFLRPLGYILSVAILLPLVISLGFFDLWFDFRQKFKN